MIIILPIALTAAAAAALINFWLGFRVGQVRTREKVSVGDGGNEAVIRRMRAHANFVEYAPFVVILIALIELATGTSTWLWIVMALFMIGRILHAFGMDGWLPGRMIGTIVTMLTMVGLGLFGAYVAQSSAGRITVPDQEIIRAG
jgi:uncharacterized protein